MQTFTKDYITSMLDHCGMYGRYQVIQHVSRRSGVVHSVWATLTFPSTVTERAPSKRDAHLMLAWAALHAAPSPHRCPACPRSCLPLGSQARPRAWAGHPDACPLPPENDPIPPGAARKHNGHLRPGYALQGCPRLTVDGLHASRCYRSPPPSGCDRCWLTRRASSGSMLHRWRQMLIWSCPCQTVRACFQAHEWDYRGGS